MNAPKTAAAVAGIILVAAAAWAPLLDRDEPRYAQAVREMRQTGDLFVPRNFGELRPDKPILIYWLQLAATAVLGEKELGFRLPSLLALAAWVWLAALLAQELRGEARWVLVPGMALAGVLATPDAVVGALTTATLLFFFRAAQSQRPGPAALAWSLFGFGVLTKGPVTPLFVIPAVIGFCGKEKALWRGVFPWWGPVLALGVVALWFWPANLATGWELARLGLGKHVVRRALEPLESHGLPGPWGILVGPPFYAASLAVASFPLAAELVRFLRSGRKQDPRLWRTVVWGIGGPLAVLSLAATKLPHYILPAVPLVLVACRPTARQQVAGATAAGLLASVLTLAAHQAPYRAAAQALLVLPEPACAFPMQEPSLRFYAGERLLVGPKEPDRCTYWLLRSGEESRLLPPQRETLQLIRRFFGWNLAKGRREVLSLYQVTMGLREKANPGPGGSSAETPTGRGFILAAKNGLPTTLRAAILAR